MKFRMILGLSVLFLSMAGAAIDDPPGNLNDDGVIDIEDMVLFAQQWLDGPGGTADFVGNDGVNFEDYAYFIQNWYYTPLLITEFMASNDTILADGNGAYSDWIEIYNPLSEAVSLADWYLTDDPNDLQRWAFPNTLTIQGGEYLLVFASGQLVQPYVDLLGYYHTNFNLNAGGEYLALVHGKRIIHEYAPKYPDQTADVSYGIGQETTNTTTLVYSPEYAVKYLVPADNTVDAVWTAAGFNDLSWSDGITGLGYETTPENYQALIETSVTKNIPGFYCRLKFTVDDPAVITQLTLRMKYDDGFVAYLNGTRVASANSNEPPQWNSQATANYSDAQAVVFDDHDISAYISLLNSGPDNVLAIHCTNYGTNSSDMLMIPELVAGVSADYQREVPMFFAAPTPEGANLGGTPYIAMPGFSRSSGIFTAGFSLTLTKLSPTASIYYTLNGTDPTLSSSLYTAAIPISGSTLVKAAVYEPGIGWSGIRAEGYSLINPDIQNFSSNLPIVVIDTFGKTISRPEYTLVQAAFIDVDPATGRAVMSGLADHTGMDGIRIRGNSSPSMPKKSYKFETWNNRREDKDVSLLGLPAESDWVLYGPIWDKTMIRDILAYQWSNEIGRYAPRTRLVEMFLNLNGGDVRMDDLGSVPTYTDTTLTYPNGPDFAYPGDYVGVYVLVEKLTRDKNRVDITKLEPFDNAEPEITGGYLIQHDCCHVDPTDSPFSCSFGAFLFEEPDQFEVTAAQRTWMINHLNSFYTVLYNSGFAGPVSGYSQYINTGSFIDHFWLSEMMRNVDAYVVSTFMFKDRLGKLNMGPLWDFNAALGYMNFMGGTYIDGWDYTWRGGDRVADIFPRLRTDPEYELALWDRWFSLREYAFRTDKLLDDIDSWAAFLEEAQARNFRRWPVLDKILLLGGLGNAYAYPTYQQDIAAMESWLVARLDWIDSQFSYTPVIFNQDGGEVNSGFSLTMTKPAGKTGTIYYTTNGTDPRVPYTGAIAGTQYTGAIALTQTVTVKARYKSGTIWSALNEATFIVGSPVVINEFMADNYATIEDPDEAGEFPDWIELYNKGSATVDLGGKFLTDDLDDPNKYEIPAGITIDPGEHLIFWADEDGLQGPTHINFKLSKTGEDIGLFDTYANGNRPLSTITFGAQTTDVSYGRYPDGSSTWGFMLTPTPWNTNSTLAP